MVITINKVQVIDAPCGAGKTSWAIQNINDNPDKSFIYCTPFLDEVDRIRKYCGNYERFTEPLPYTSTKIDDFNSLLAQGKDVAVTHTTFLNATPETLDLIRVGNYVLIIDEVLDVVEDFNKSQSVESSDRQSMSSSDIKFLLDNNIIRIEPDNKVIWCGGEYGKDYKFSEVKRYAELGRLYCVGGNFLLTIFPPEIFSYFQSAYVLTYIFGGSAFKYYFDLFNIEYELKCVSHSKDIYSLVGYTADYDANFRKNCKALINICNNPKMNNYTKRTALSKGWYDKTSIEEIKRLKANIFNFFRNLDNAKAKDEAIMWTCPKEYKEALKGQGYTMSRALTKDDRFLPQKERKDLEAKISCFVPCNAKSTNIYNKRWALAYCFNMFFNPMIRRFFTDNNTVRKQKGLTEVLPNEDLYALSCLIQWVFRSRIRESKPIYIYIPCERMRKLFIDWLDCKI